MSAPSPPSEEPPTRTERAAETEPLHRTPMLDPTAPRLRQRAIDRVSRTRWGAHALAWWAPHQQPMWGSSGDAFDGDLVEHLPLVRASYDAVLAQSIRIDEKLRSLITALAFLTTAGISLFVFGANRTLSDLQLDIGCVVVSLSSALVALDPSSHRPTFFPLEAERRFASVLHYDGDLGSVDGWWRQGTPPQPLRDLTVSLVDSYRRETHEISRRARHKVQRSRNTEAFMSSAIVALFCLAATRLPESANETRELVVLLILVGFAWFPLATVYRMRRDALPGISSHDLPISFSVLDE